MNCERILELVSIFVVTEIMTVEGHEHRHLTHITICKQCSSYKPPLVYPLSSFQSLLIYWQGWGLDVLYHQINLSNFYCSIFRS
jgi:hypothetical protein